MELAFVNHLQEMERKMSLKVGRVTTHTERGAVSIEMALLTLLLSALMFGIVELARYGLLRYHLDRATYHAARYLMLNPNQTDVARAMLNIEVARNFGGRVDDIQLTVTNARRDGQCLLVVSSNAAYPISELNWLIAIPNLESVQVLPNTNECEQYAMAYPVATRTPKPTPTVVVTRALPVLLDETEGVALVNANIRLGPGFEYAIVGRLSENEVVQVRGRDKTVTWLQIMPERVGWVYAPLIQIDEPVSSLQVVAAPPIPSTTPPPLVRLRFDAEPEVLKFGECAWLRWSAADANFVTLNEKNVSTQGEEKVCPNVDTKYVLSAGYSDKRFYDREIKILVKRADEP